MENAAKWECSVLGQQSSWVWVNASWISKHVSAALPMPSDDVEIKISGEEIRFSLLKLELLTFVFFLTCFNINKSIQYQGRCLLGKNVMILLPRKKYLWENILLWEILILKLLFDSPGFSIELHWCWWCYRQIRRGACFPFPPNAFLFRTCILMFKRRAGNQFVFSYVFVVQRQTPLDRWVGRNTGLSAAFALSFAVLGSHRP